MISQFRCIFKGRDDKDERLGSVKNIENQELYLAYVIAPRNRSSASTILNVAPE